MKAKFQSWIVKLIMLALLSCVNRLENEPAINTAEQIVVDGLITNEPGPHKVRVFRTHGAYSNLQTRIPINVKEISIIDDQGKVEQLSAEEPGVYVTSEDFNGAIGRTYTLRFTDQSGEKFESLPETILSQGSIDSVYFSFDTKDILNGPPEYGFRIFVRAKTAPDEEGFYRFRYEGTYKIRTFPEAKTKVTGYFFNEFPDPPECANYYPLFAIEKCECCFCWVSLLESKPTVKSSKVISGNQFGEIEIAWVPINGFTFYDKVRVEVKHMRISENAFAFWNRLDEQIEGATNLFQPPGGIPRGNIMSLNSERHVDGLFYAASVETKVIYITSFDARKHTITQPADSVKEDCRIYPFSTNKKPVFWED